jgi:hypothetical protein
MSESGPNHCWGSTASIRTGLVSKTVVAIATTLVAPLAFARVPSEPQVIQRQISETDAAALLIEAGRPQ